MTDSTPPILITVGDALHKRLISWQRPECGLSGADRWIVQFDDGTSAFIKAATDQNTTDWLVNERNALEIARTQFAPNIIAWLEADFPILVMEDMSAGYWPAGTGEVHWRDGDMDAVIATLEQLRTVEVDGTPPQLPEPALIWNDLLSNPALVQSGLCSNHWIERYGPAILAAEQVPVEAGRSLVHGDVRSDNLCIYPGGHVRFGDWAQAGVGHPYHDLISLLPTLRLEGGPRPSTVLYDHVGLIVRFAGANISRALGDESGPDWLRAVLLRLAAIHLEWVSDILYLPPASEDDHV